MDCKRVKKLLPDFLELNLTEDLQQKVKTHIDSCEYCTKIYWNLKQSLDLLKPTAGIAEQAFYYERLKQKMENRLESKNSLLSVIFSKKLVQPVIYLSSIILAVYIGILIGSNNPSFTQYSEIEADENINPIETFAEYSYLNDYEIETIENLITESDDDN